MKLSHILNILIIYYHICPRLSIALTVQNRGLKHQSVIIYLLSYIQSAILLCIHTSVQVIGPRKNMAATIAAAI